MQSVPGSHRNLDRALSAHGRGAYAGFIFLFLAATAFHHLSGRYGTLCNGVCQPTLRSMQLFVFDQLFN